MIIPLVMLKVSIGNDRRLCRARLAVRYRVRLPCLPLVESLIPSLNPSILDLIAVANA